MAYNAQLTPAQALFTMNGSTQPSAPAPVLPVLQDSTCTQSWTTVLLLPAEGTVRNFTPPPNWSQIRQFQVVNTDVSGYALLTLDPGTALYTFVLAPQGGQFTCTSASATSGIDAGNFTVQSCDSAGVPDNGVATQLWVYGAGV